MTYTYAAIVRDVHDGDTVKVDVDLGWKSWRHDEPLRLVGINAPELATAAGKAAAAYLQTLLKVGDQVVIQTQQDKTEKYGRMLATIWHPATPLGTSINDTLVTAGHAKPWDGKGVRP